jgi:hypothetical protein
MSFEGIEIVAWSNPQPADGDVILAKIEVSSDGVVDAWRVDGGGSQIGFKISPALDGDMDMFSLVELLGKMCRTVDTDGAVIMHAMLSTSRGCPQPGERLLIAMPTPNTNPHAVGRIVSVAEAPRGRLEMPIYKLTIAVESADDEAARAEYPQVIALDCYPSATEAERWHAIDGWHVRIHGYGRNHWS